MPDVVLDYHRLCTPIDHPDLSVTRSKLELTSDNLLYHLIKGSAKLIWMDDNYYVAVAFPDIYADKAFRSMQMAPPSYIFSGVLAIRMGSFMYNQDYEQVLQSPNTAHDHWAARWQNGTRTELGYEAVDLTNYYMYTMKFSASGSTFKCFRTNMDTPRFTFTDTVFASGYIGLYSELYQGNTLPVSTAYAYLEAPASASPRAMAVVEVQVEGSGRRDEPFRPSLRRNLADILRLEGLPDFLYQEAKKYQVLRSRGFTDEEIQLLFGHMPQYQVDLDSVTCGTFEFHPDKADTVITTIFGDNPYKTGAVERQKVKAERVFNVPEDYGEAVALYNQLRKDYPHWLAGKDNFAYQVLGLEIFDFFQNIDFYYGELIELIIKNLNRFLTGRL
jgi:hypothetical protein